MQTLDAPRGCITVVLILKTEYKGLYYCKKDSSWKALLKMLKRNVKG